MMADELGPDEERFIEQAEDIVQTALDEADAQGLPPEAMTEALVEAVAHSLVRDLGRDGAVQVLEEMIEDIRKGGFDPEGDAEEEDGAGD
jgi:hypothetical protein